MQILISNYSHRFASRLGCDSYSRSQGNRPWSEKVKVIIFDNSALFWKKLKANSCFEQDYTVWESESEIIFKQTYSHWQFFWQTSSLWESESENTCQTYLLSFPPKPPPILFTLTTTLWAPIPSTEATMLYCPSLTWKSIFWLFKCLFILGIIFALIGGWLADGRHS